MRLQEAVESLRGAGVESPRRNAEALLERTLGYTRERLLAGAQPDADQALAFETLCRRRASREPLEYLLGQADFAGITLTCDRRALIPRPETEDLVELAARRAPTRVADVGTGTGAIALALKSRLPASAVVATDASPDALALAKENAKRLGLTVDFRLGNDLEPLDGAFDAIVANPPYVTEAEFRDLMPEVRDWEPRMALIGGPEGTEILARWIAVAPRFLKPGGWLAVEVGAGQTARVEVLFQSAGFGGITTAMDFAGIGRFVSGTRHG